MLATGGSKYSSSKKGILVLGGRHTKLIYPVATYGGPPKTGMIDPVKNHPPRYLSFDWMYVVQLLPYSS